MVSRSAVKSKKHILDKYMNMKELFLHAVYSYKYQTTAVCSTELHGILNTQLQAQPRFALYTVEHLSTQTPLLLFHKSAEVSYSLYKIQVFRALLHKI